MSCLMPIPTTSTASVDPAAGVAANITLPAPGSNLSYRLVKIVVNLIGNSSAVTANVAVLQVNDNTGNLFTWRIVFPAGVAQTSVEIPIPVQGHPGSNMSIGFVGGFANLIEDVSVEFTVV